MRKVTQLLLMAFTVASFAACSGSKSMSTNPGDLKGDWKLASMNGSEMSSGNYTISFNTDGTIAGKADCNYVTGEYSVDKENEGAINLNSVASTKAMCGEGESNSSSYAEAVKGIESFQVMGGNQLTLATGSGELVFDKVMMEEGEGDEEMEEGNGNGN